MIRRGRIRLALICAAMTSVVLALLMLAVAGLSESEYRAARAALLQAEAGRITSQLLTNHRLSDKWLEQAERSGGLIISIEDNGVPLYFRGGWRSPTPRAALISRAEDEAAKAGFDRSDFYAMASPTEQITFILEGDFGDRYRCAVIRASSPEGRYNITVLADMRAENAHISRQRVIWLLLTVAGFLLFSALGWQLAGIAVKPLEENMDRQNAFIAAASHELRSPLCVISAAASAMRIEREKADDYIGMITKECTRLGGLVDDLLLLAQSGVRSWKLEKRAVRLDTLLIETVEQFEPAARQAGHTLALELPGGEELQPVYGDATRIRQIVANLISNAISHSGGSGAIEVRGLARQRRVLIEVADHGAGIPDAGKPRVFERFYRAEASRANKAHSGLGLSIADELARLHGGKVTLRDTPGGGCTFAVSLPVQGK